MTNTSYIHISWKQISSCITKLAKRIEKPDIIITISRGGNIPGSMLAYALNVEKVVNFSVQTYDNQTRTNNIKVLQEPDIVLEEQMDNILVVDDLVDSGSTLSFVRDYFKSKDIEVKYSTLYIKKGTTFTPDYYAGIIDGSKWVVFPWDNIFSSST